MRETWLLSNTRSCFLWRHLTYLSLYGMRLTNEMPIIYRMDKQQGPTAERREQYSISCDKPWEKSILKRIQKSKSLWYTAEINTAL